MLEVSRKNTFLYFTIFWFIVSFLYFLGLNYISNGKADSRLIDAFIFFLFFLALGYASKFPTKYISFESSKPLKIFFNHAFASMVVTGIWLKLNYLILFELANQSKVYHQFFLDTILWRVIIGILIYSVFVIFHYTMLYYESYNEKLEREAELKTSIIEAELRNLRFQINPHFIFNCLNSITSLTVSNPDKAREMTIKLSDYLRYTLAKSEKRMSKLGDELKNVNLYFEIEKIRFGEKFEYEELVPLAGNVPDNLLNVEIPSMILQPLSENAIKHGVYESLEKVNIKLNCIREGNYLKITIENNFDPDSKRNDGEGIGLKNIRERLKLIYGIDNLVSVNAKENLFSVTLYVPIFNEARP
ncbi:MAG: histidine kinase [Bacteroidetes bacterium]|nr:histidine kinase [Bacteroidota bacterium]MBU2585091.1 histidine kinase [Bacteroidota bacterium]